MNRAAARVAGADEEQHDLQDVVEGEVLHLASPLEDAVRRAAAELELETAARVLAGRVPGAPHTNACPHRDGRPAGP